MTLTTFDNNYAVANFIVSADPGKGNYTTIASAITAASSPATIFIKPGTYTENLTMKAGVNLVAFDADAFTPNVTIVGKITCTYTGVASISGIRLNTNSDYAIQSTGTNACSLNITDSVLVAVNNTLINSTNANFTLFIDTCTAGISTTGIAYFAMTGGNLSILDSVFNNAGGSTTASTFSGSILSIRWSFFSNPITTSGSSATFSAYYCTFDTNSLNATVINSNATTSSNFLFYCHTITGTATPITIGSGSTLNVSGLSIQSSNATSISGAGALVYDGIDYISTVGAITVTTITGKGTIGILNGTAPAAGQIGEVIESIVLVGSAVALTNGTPTNITSISLTPGNWLITGQITYSGGAITGTQFNVSINTTSATSGTIPTNRANGPTAPTANSDVSYIVSGVKATVSATTTYYLVAQGNYTVGSLTGYGRITAYRIA